jgi:mRNA-degrading endonuclease toxin of MazEF toxin-antitoxin module
MSRLFLESDSIVLAHQIRTISKQRLMICLGEISEANLQAQINDALRVHLNL